MDFMKQYKDMTYNEFIDACTAKAICGCWGFEEATTCISIIEDLQDVKVKRFGITMKKKTQKAREEVWESVKKLF